MAHGQKHTTSFRPFLLSFLLLVLVAGGFSFFRAKRLEAEQERARAYERQVRTAVETIIDQR